MPSTPPTPSPPPPAAQTYRADTNVRRFLSSAPSPRYIARQRILGLSVEGSGFTIELFTTLKTLFGAFAPQTRFALTRGWQTCPSKRFGPLKQGLETLLSQQRALLSTPKSDACKLIPTEGPLTESRHVQLVNNEDYILSKDGSFATKAVGVRAFIEDLVSFVLNLIEEVSDAEMNEDVCQDCAWVHSSMVAGIAGIVAERDSDNYSDNSVLPHQLVKIRGSTHRQRLKEIDYIEQDHESLLDDYRSHIARPVPERRRPQECYRRS